MKTAWKTNAHKMIRACSAAQQVWHSILEQNVRERTYNYRKLITGIIQHDIYHLGQIAFITKALGAANEVSSVL